jgi:exopolysaccharide production repressor protein
MVWEMNQRASALIGGLSLQQYLPGFLAVLAVFAATTYFMTQSVWTAFVQTAICALLLQMGYFVAVLLLIWRSGPNGSRGP